MDRHQSCPREESLQIGIGLHRAAVGRRDIQHRGVDQPAARLVHEIDLTHHREESIEGFAAEVDHLGNLVAFDQLVEQRHLPLGVAQIGDRGIAGQVIRQRILVAVDVEGVGGRPFASRNSASVRAIKVLPERPRGEQTMKTGGAARRHDRPRSRLAGTHLTCDSGPGSGFAAWARA